METGILDADHGEPTRLAKQQRQFDDPSMWNHLLASNVRHFRLKKNITQESLAEECGIFRTYLSKIETGKCNPSLSVMVALADTLGIMPHALLTPME
jgi:DNA-binding XRE family transcriptional regulator